MNQITHAPASVILLALIFFFPLGLLLLAINEDFSKARKAKWTYWFVGIFVTISVVSLGILIPAEMASKGKIEQANELWDAGKQTEAAILYYEAADWCPDSHEPLLYGRLLDYEASRGNQSGVEEVLKHIEDYGGNGDMFDPIHLPDCQTPEGKAVVERLK